MTKHNLHTDPKWDALLNSYRQGSISPEDLHLLEKAALDDPFLFDAMEGYALNQSSIDATHIQNLADFKANQNTKVRYIHYKRWASVAALFLVLLLVTFLVKDQLSDKVQILAEAQPSEKMADTMPMADVMSSDNVDGEIIPKTSDAVRMNPQKNESDNFSSIKIGDVKAKTSTSDNGNPSMNKEKTSLQKEKQKPAVSANAYDPDIDEPETTKKMESPMKNALSEMEGSDESTRNKIHQADVPSMVNQGNVMRNESTDLTADGKMIVGIITDRGGLPLIGANISIENTQIGTVSDIDGKFTLPSYPSGIQMIATYTGYEPSYVMIEDDSFYQISLSEGQMLDEIVVSSMSELATEKEAIPEIGFKGLEAFIKQYKSVPLDAFAANFKGRITVEFVIQKNGTLADFSSTDKGCDACIEEAIRLLKLAGKWKSIPEGISRRAAYTITF